MAFIEAKVQNLFAAEQAGSFKGQSLDKVTHDMDPYAAKNLDARWRMEHADAYCLARDHRYGRRSRRWLQARAIHTQLSEDYAEWTAFVRENDVVAPDIDKLPTLDSNTLATKPFEEIMK